MWVVSKVLRYKQKDKPLYTILFFLWKLTTTSYKLEKADSNLCFNFCGDETHRKLKGDPTNLKMDKTEILSVIKYQQKISNTLKEIH